MSTGSEDRTPAPIPDPASVPPDPLGHRLRRRTLLGAAAGAAAAGAVGVGPRNAIASPAAAVPAAAPAGQAVPALPPDAAPPERQVYVAPDNVSIAKVLDFYEQVYERPSEAASDLFSDPLIRLNKNFELIPAAALEWSGSEDGRTWTFRLDPNLVWSDGTPVTAEDWIATFRYAADPGHAWDFSWFWASQGTIKNWNQALEGAVPTDQIGVRQGPDAQTLIFESEEPAPYMPAKLLYSLPLSAKALAEHGPLYNTNPETAVSAGPFILSEWQRDQRIVYVRNEQYTGQLKVPVNKVIVKLAAPDAFFTMYENDEVDFMNKPAPAQLKLMQDDPEKASQVHSGVGDFRCFYLFFDVTKAPFDNIKVRQAFSHAIDREAIASQILGPAGAPAYSWLAPGFPAANGDALKEIQKFDPALAKQLLAEAGFPEGEGFPAQEMWLRAPSPLDQGVAGAMASMIKENLGIDVEIAAKDQQGFTAALNAKPTEILFGYVSYGMDFLDPANMLGVWHSGGRHSWVNEAFDTGLDEAASFVGDPQQRLTMFQEVERILVEDVPGVFVYHETPVQLIKPWLKGDFIAPDENGISSMHWPGYSCTSTVPEGLYIGADAPEGREG